MPFVTVKIARKDAPLREGGNSFAGHMWFSLSHENGERLSYGFGPEEKGSKADGRIITNDDKNYLNVYHQQSFSITEKDYKKLKEFAQNPSKYGFDMDYRSHLTSFFHFAKF